MSPTRRADRRAARRARRARLTTLLIAAAVAVGACHPPINALDDAGRESASIARLGWFMIAMAAAVYAVVIGLLVAAMVRNRKRDPAAVDLTERGLGWIVIGGGVFPALLLTAIFVVAMGTMGMTPSHRDREAYTFRVTATQWWWKVELASPDPQQRFVTANELHIPVGRAVRVLLTSNDVIHSFWVPDLQGKLDAIPGDTNDLRLFARRAGTYVGECAEFCGMQHAHMRFTVVAESDSAFANWVRGQLAPAVTPADTLAATGARLFAAGPCALCHTVRGTPAMATVAPDLTHVGSRLTIGAGTLPNTAGNLESWIVNAPALKPGTRMPAITQFSGPELRALVAYVKGLR